LPDVQNSAEKHNGSQLQKSTCRFRYEATVDEFTNCQVSFCSACRHLDSCWLVPGLDQNVFNFANQVEKHHDRDWPGIRYLMPNELSLMEGFLTTLGESF